MAKDQPKGNQFWYAEDHRSHKGGTQPPPPTPLPVHQVRRLVTFLGPPIPPLMVKDFILSVLERKEGEHTRLMTPF